MSNIEIAKQRLVREILEVETGSEGCSVKLRHLKRIS